MSYVLKAISYNMMNINNIRMMEMSGKCAYYVLISPYQHESNITWSHAHSWIFMKWEPKIIFTSQCIYLLNMTLIQLVVVEICSSCYIHHKHTHACQHDCKGYRAFGIVPKRWESYVCKQRLLWQRADKSYVLYFHLFI